VRYFCARLKIFLSSLGKRPEGKKGSRWKPISDSIRTTPDRVRYVSRGKILEPRKFKTAFAKRQPLRSSGSGRGSGARGQEGKEGKEGRGKDPSRLN
jgi:hypothetical protein